jgi:hypothetical protein
VLGVGRVSTEDVQDWETSETVANVRCTATKVMHPALPPIKSTAFSSSHPERGQKFLHPRQKLHRNRARSHVRHVTTPSYTPRSLLLLLTLHQNSTDIHQVQTLPLKIRPVCRHKQVGPYNLKTSEASSSPPYQLDDQVNGGER